MKREYLQKVFSNERMDRYYARYPGNEAKAFEHYKQNILISESFYPLLTVFEVSLRNSLNRELSAYFETPDWYKRVHSIPGLINLSKAISIAQKHIAQRNEPITSSKVVAELTLGFWVQLFNAEYERFLWKNLRLAFPYMPKNQRTRKAVSAPVNKIRNFRNRIFHHEPISWKMESLETLRTDLYDILGWINEELPEFVGKIDRIIPVIEAAKSKLYE